MSTLPRYLPDRALPRRAYLPGRDPHPTRSRSQALEELDLSSECERIGGALDEAYLWGAELYNHGFFWEAHEAWEALWSHAQKGSDRRAFFQGLIQCAAACLKRELGDIPAARRLALRAIAHLERVKTGPSHEYMGLAVERFCVGFKAYACAEAGGSFERPLLELALQNA